MKTPKLTRAQIRETLQQVPIESVLLGHSTSKEKRLTPSQIKFAEELAKGSSKAEAYRRSRPNGRKSNAKPESQSREGQKLAHIPAVASQVEAFKLAIEAQKYATPLHLRALVIHKLTEKALDSEVPPAQQIKALELLGKLTEVGAFTERREVTTITDSATMRAKLMHSLKLAISSQDAEVIDQADDLLAELSGESGADAAEVSDDDAQTIEPDQSQELENQATPLEQSPDPETHTTPSPKNRPLSIETISHSNPLTTSPTNANHSQVTPVIGENEEKSE